MRLFCCFFTRTLPIASCLGFFLLPVTGMGQEELRQKDREAIIDSVGTYVDAFQRARRRGTWEPLVEIW